MIPPIPSHSPSENSACSGSQNVSRFRIWSTCQPLLASSCAMKRRWHCQGDFSAHMKTLDPKCAIRSNSAKPRKKLSEVICSS